MSGKTMPPSGVGKPFIRIAALKQATQITIF
jgi:hypothetical protein